MRRSHPTSPASVAGAVLGIILIALAVAAAVPVAMNWPAWWPGVLLVLVLGCSGVALIARHMSRHRVSQAASERVKG
jgi:ABC-type antimicrobial peptide transport system permease subunit